MHGGYAEYYANRMDNNKKSEGEECEINQINMNISPGSPFSLGTFHQNSATLNTTLWSIFSLSTFKNHHFSSNDITRNDQWTLCFAS